MFALRDNALWGIGFCNLSEEVELIEEFDIKDYPIYDFDVDELANPEDYKDYVWYKAMAPRRMPGGVIVMVERILAIPKFFFEKQIKI